MDSQALRGHRAMLGFELEVLAMKLDRFGWERGRGTPVQDRLITDWMDVLQDYPLDEVKAGINAYLDVKPGKMPNERDVLAAIMLHRERFLLMNRNRKAEAEKAAAAASAAPCSPDAAAAILEEFEFRPKRFPGVGEGDG